MSNPARAGAARSVRSVGARPRKKRKPRALSQLERDRLHNRLVRLTPSEPWTNHCKAAIAEGLVVYKTEIERELRQTQVFPPGGYQSSMIRCGDCGTLNPPQASHRPTLIDQFRLNNALRAMKLSSRRVAQICRVDVELVILWRRGRACPEPAPLRRLSDLLGIDPGWLVREHAICDPCMEARKLRGRKRETSGLSHRTTTSSPTAVARMAMEVQGVELVEDKLEPEDEASLRAQIDRYLAAAGAHGDTRLAL